VSVLVLGRVGAAPKRWQGHTGAGGLLDLGRDLLPLVRHPCVSGL
jgi:hypothetical protein